jgi:mono/diheme cytochrome c family protein
MATRVNVGRLCAAGVLAGAIAWGAAAAGSAKDGPAPGDSAAVFEKRILPILKSPEPSSCTECHLAGVDLKNYILPTAEKTFASLRDQGLIDVDAPEKSKVLALITMREGLPKGAALIDPKVREAERAAFAAWVAAAAKDPAMRALPKLKAEERAGPRRPAAVIRHARVDRVTASLEDNVWAQRFRCAGCHTEGGPENARLVKEHGDITWLKTSPAETLTALREKNLINVDEPEKSLLLRKPLGEVKHGGGVKMIKGDLGYKMYRAFLDDYAKSINDRYAAAAELPKGSDVARFGTDVWLKIEGTPPAWGDKPLEVRVFARDEKGGGWEKTPIAVSDRAVWGGGKVWQHSLLLLAEKGSEREKALRRQEAPALPAGRYLVKVYVDTAGKLAKDWTARLGDEEYVGQVEVESKWPAGYGRMTVVKAAAVMK